jgi:LysM repeat protein
MPRRSSASSRRWRTVGLLFLALVAGLAAMRWFQGRNMLLPATASLLVLENDVKVVMADAGQATLQMGQTLPLQRGDQVMTGAGGRAKLTFPGGETTELGANTDLSILELHESSVSRTLVVALALQQGSTLTRIRHMLLQGMRFEIETPAASVGARGTVFRCDVLDKAHAYVAVYEGVVSVSMGENSVELASGQGLDVRLGQPLQPVAVSGDPVLGDVAANPAGGSGETGANKTPPAPDATATLTVRELTLFPAVETPTLPGDEYGSYTVRAGDTLYSIARQYGLPWETIWEANKSALERPEMLQVGQTLRIPPAP